jgi:two-component system chemotaxis sensor kinase CheA
LDPPEPAYRNIASQPDGHAPGHDGRQIDENQGLGASSSELPEARSLATSSPSTAGDARTGEATANTIRVAVDRIDHIVTLTGEVLVVKNAIGHWAQQASTGADPAALAAGLRTQYDALSRHLTDLQAAAFQLRVLPMDRVFGRFPRLVRETAASLGKRVRLLTEGEDTRADKAVVEALFEPLLHLVRNALDHGIETPEERLATGKPAEAVLILRAFREGDQVIVELEDDGRGIDVARIRHLALARGAVEEAALSRMDDDQAAAVIFAPGFSTAASVTDLSGRGVGMGAVKTAIERVGGEAVLVNRPGKGLTVRLLLPFTIALTRIMTLEAGGQTFGLPFDAIVETVRLPRTAIRPLGQGRAVVIRGRTLPVIDLAERLDLPRSTSSDTACLLVVWAADRDIALEVERPGERFDMMMKPATGLLAGLPAVAGTSLTGDGRVLVILDPKALLT